jgi:hypothetical protein
MMMRAITKAAVLGAVSALACACGRVVVPNDPDENEPDVPSYPCEAKEEWSITAPGRHFQRAFAHDGGFVVADSLQYPIGVLSLDNLGNTRWEAGLALGLGRLFASDSGIVVAGTPEADVYAIEATALSAADGAPLWSASFGPDEKNVGYRPVTVVADGDSFIVVALGGPPPTDQYHLVVARIGPGGIVEWVRTFGKENTDGLYPSEHVFGAFLDAKGRVVIASMSRPKGDGGQTPWLFSLTHEGEIAWEYSEDIEFRRAYGSWVLLPTKDGGSLATGTLPSDDVSGPTRALRLDSEGALLWSLELDDEVAAALETESSELVLAGRSASSTEGRVWWVSPGGKLVRSIDYPQAGGPIRFLRAMPGGGYVLGSTTRHPGSIGPEAWHLLRISSAGDLLWVYDVINDESAGLGDVVVGQGGEVLAAGSLRILGETTGRIIALKERCEKAEP